MKTNTLLFLAGLAVLTTGARAASIQNESEPVVLPTYVVTATRYPQAEAEINASLKEFVQQASMPLVITPELTLRKSPLVQATRVVPALRLAKS